MLAVGAAAVSFWAYHSFAELVARDCRVCLYAMVVVPALALVLGIISLRGDWAGLSSAGVPLATVGLVLIVWRATEGVPACAASVDACPATASGWMYGAAAALEVGVLAAAALLPRGRQLGR